MSEHSVNERDKVSGANIVMPRTARRARLAGVGDLLGLLPRANNKTIAALASRHPNTVGPKLDGAPGQYAVVNDIFTALNKLGDGAFQRRRHVLIFDETKNEFVIDEAFDMCLVFFGSPQLLRDAGIAERDLANSAQVPLIYIRAILSGRPVFSEFVERTFEALRKHSRKEIERSEYLFN
jgi:hypothetical protein